MFSLLTLSTSTLFFFFSFFPQCYAGIRQTASSLLRLALDPEHGRPSDPASLRRPFDSEFGGGASNPLVQLLSLGGVGSSAPKQMQLDSDTEGSGDEDCDDNGHPTAASWMDSYGRPQQRALSEKQKKRMQEEARKRRKAARHALRQKKHMVAADPLIHFAYMPTVSAMHAVATVMEDAAKAWQQLQAAPAPSPSAAASPTSSSASSPHSLLSFLRAFPPSLLVDLVDFLSFMCLRHSVVFRKFAKERHIIHTLAQFFPTPKLTPKEEEAERAQQQQQIAAAAAARAAAAPKEEGQEGGVKTETAMADATTVDSNGGGGGLAVPQLSPSPSPPPASVVASSDATSPLFVFTPPTLTLPTPVLCACIRFFRISVEVDPCYTHAVSHTHAHTRTRMHARARTSRGAVCAAFLRVDLCLLIFPSSCCPLPCSFNLRI